MKTSRFIIVVFLLCFSKISIAQTTTLIATNSSWKYLSNGSNQGTAWRDVAFSDATWKSGNAELGYGDGGEATVIPYGSSGSKYITYYFRKSFTISNPSLYTSMLLSIMRDDGAVVYLNGTEVARSNMPTGTISYTTLSSSAVGAINESSYYPFTISPALLVAGINVLAVEIHQNTKTSPDLSFNCKLTASTTVVTPPTFNLTRGPYLQSAASNSIVIRWRTDIATDSKVNYGTSLTYGNSKTDAISTTEHIVKLSGLTAGTLYYYSIGSTTATVQGNASNYFKTAPITGSTTPVRIWATGDFGTGTAAQFAVRDAFVNYTTTTPADLWLWMGDNAYAAGYDNEYQTNVFNVYPNQFKSIPVFPCLGNHDYANVGYQSTSALGTNFPYFRIFSVPSAGEAGGVASGSSKYYSYNYANIHFIALDSYGSLNTTSSPMYTWLQSDLAANTQTWTVVYFHHPPYTKGTHNSDSETELIKMRQNIVPLLESYHVDLVLNGHSHSNERSYLIKGHLGLANTFTSSMKMSTSANNFVKSAPYNGTVYAVCGSSGQNVGGTSSGWPMPCMNFSNNTYNASLVMDVNGNTFVCKYLSSTGTIVDQFTITKVTNTARLADNDFKIYQNAEQIVLDFPTDENMEGDLSFYNLEGKLMQTFTSIEVNAKEQNYIPKEKFTIPTGIYIAVLSTSKGRYSQKVFLNF